MARQMCTVRTSLAWRARSVSQELGLWHIRRGPKAALFFAAKHADMVVSLAVNEPPALGVLNVLSNSADILKEFAGLAPAREALKVGDVQRGIPMFVDVVGGPGAYERRSDADKKMNLGNVASYQADAIERP